MTSGDSFLLSCRKATVMLNPYSVVSASLWNMISRLLTRNW